MSQKTFLQSSQWHSFLTKIYGWGASVVILGCLFKIQHWAGANIMLSVGLITEAIVFFFSAFEPMREDVDWTLVYPELAGNADADNLHKSRKFGGGYSGGTGSVALAKFDEMLENAEISPDLFVRLGIGMKKLSETTANINAMGDVSVASAKYANTINSANDSLSRLSDSYQTATKAINDTRLTYRDMSDSVSTIETVGKSYQQQLEIINKNLSALNSVYELQRQHADNYMKQTDVLFKDMHELMRDLTDSAGNTKLYSEQISKLNDNLSALNSVYGNMLAAMNLKKY